MNVPVEAVIGQWGLETGWGKSVIPGTHNYGNIKSFRGDGVEAKDNMTGSVDKYRKYGSPDEFADDFTVLLGNRRYAGSLNAKDAQAYFTGLKAGGYAEDPNYVQSGTKAAQMVAQARAKMGADAVHPPTTVAKNDPAPIPSAFEPATDPKLVKTSFVSIGSNTVKSIKGSDTPIVPPDTQWKPPATAVQAAPEFQGGKRAIVTFGEQMTATKVKDGDGVDLKRGDGSKVVCRIEAIDAPEVAHMEDYVKDKMPHQNFGERSKKILADMIENKQVTVRITEPATSKNYNRNVCQIEIEGKDVSEEMLRKGAAWLYSRYVKDPSRRSQLLNASMEGQRNKAGMFEEGAVNNINPEQWRDMARKGIVR